MKKIILIISSLILLGCQSCKLDTDTSTMDAEGAKKATNLIPHPPPITKYYTIFQDRDCKIQIDSAKQDVLNGKLVYEDNGGGWTIIRYDDEMEEILNQYGIGYIESGLNCTMEQECYGYYMDSIISQRFGTGFIKQIKNRADSLFLSRWKTKTYESWDIDESPYFKEGNAESFIQSRIKFPRGWDTIPMEFERQFVMVDAYIGNDGKLMKWELHEFYNLKESNEQYLPELKKQIDRILNYMNDWNPGKLMGKDVNSTIWLDIDLDKER